MYMNEISDKELLICIENILCTIGNLKRVQDDFNIPIPANYIAQLLNKIIVIIYGNTEYKLSVSNKFGHSGDNLFVYTEADEVLSILSEQQVLDFAVSLNNARRKRNPLLLDFMQEIRLWLNKFLGRVNIVDGEMISKGER